MPGSSVVLRPMDAKYSMKARRDRVGAGVEADILSLEV
jgi:hypothetical protein